MGAIPTKTFPPPSAVGGSQAFNPINQAQAPILSPISPTAPTPPMGRGGAALLPGQAAPPIAGTPLNPWGVNRGGSGLIPVYRRVQSPLS